MLFANSFYIKQCNQTIKEFDSLNKQNRKLQTYNAFSGSTIFFVPWEAIDDKFLVLAPLHCLLQKLDNQIGRNKPSFFLTVLNHFTIKKFVIIKDVHNKVHNRSFIQKSFLDFHHMRIIIFTSEY